jgi:hypothetical protein
MTLSPVSTLEKRAKCCWLFLGALWLSVGFSAAQSIYTVPELPATTRGQQVTIHGQGLSGLGVKVFLRTGKEAAGDKGHDCQITSADEKSLSFSLPRDMETGRYLVYVATDTQTLLVPGDLHVLPDSDKPVTLDGIYPLTDYRKANHDRFDFEIAGQNLAAKPEDNLVEIVGQGPLAVGDPASCAAWKKTNKYDKPCLEVDPGMETYKLKVVGFQPDAYQGPVQVRVQVGNNVSKPFTVVFSGASQAAVLLGAVAVFGAIALVFLGLVWKGIGVFRLNGENYGPWTALFLDRETNSYSLSKFQVVSWTAVLVYGYVYLFLCRSLIQWETAFPPIPDNIAALFFVSAGTVVAAAGITSGKGPKGAGPIKPSPADFISTGGLVVGERFQFFVWTLVGCLGYLFIVIRNNPAEFKELPQVPQGLLYLMGVSAAAYLGGKLARKQGPVISVLSVENIAQTAASLPANLVPPKDIQVRAPVLTIDLKGQGLDPKASIKVDGQTLRGDMFWITASTPQDPQTEFAEELHVNLNAPEGALDYLEGGHTLTLVSRDGQSATVNFPIDPMSIESVAASAGTTDVTVKGTNFAEGTSAEWKDKSEANVPVTGVTINGPTEAVVHLGAPGATAGAAKLTLISPVGLRASKSVNVS